MKKSIFALVILSAAAVLAFQPKPAPKTYIVSLTLEQWNFVLNTTDSVSKMLVESDLPARQVTGVMQNLASVRQEFQKQVSIQLQADIEKAKADSIANKTPKDVKKP